MRKTKTIFVLFIIFIMFLLTSCSSGNTPEPVGNTSEPSDTGKTIEIQFGNTSSPKEPMNIALREVFVPRVSELTNGVVNASIFDNSQLGGESDMLEQMQLGTLNMGYISSVLGTVYPKIYLLDLPYLFKDYEHIDAVFEGEIGKDLQAGLSEVGLVGLGYFENGYRQFTNSIRPIEKMSDIKGLKVRTPTSDMNVSVINTLGANAMPMSFNEVYSALQQGVLDGQENPYNVSAANSFFEVQKYVAETKHLYGSFSIMAGKTWWDGLPNDIQEAIKKAINETIAYEKKIAREKSSESLELLLEKGMELTKPDLAEFEEATKPIYDSYIEKNPDAKQIIDAIKAIK